MSDIPEKLLFPGRQDILLCGHEISNFVRFNKNGTGCLACLANLSHPLPDGPKYGPNIPVHPMDSTIYRSSETGTLVRTMCLATDEDHPGRRVVIFRPVRPSLDRWVCSAEKFLELIKHEGEMKPRYVYVKPAKPED